LTKVDYLVGELYIDNSPVFVHKNVYIRCERR